jgi:hypothetical protein
MSFLGAVLILRSAIGRHMVHGSVVPSISLVIFLFRVWFILSTLSEDGECQGV